MSTELLIGDLHLRENNKELVAQFFKSLLVFVKENNIKIVKFLGDCYNQRAVIRTDLQRILVGGIAPISKIANIHIVVGNHDYDSLDTMDTHSLEVLHWLFGDRVKIYNSITFDEGSLYIPYTDDYGSVLNAINVNKGKINTIYCHLPISGFYLTPFHKETKGVPPDWFSGIKTFAGHFHKTQITDNIIYPGSVFVNSFAEAGMSPSLFVYDTETKEHEQVSISDLVNDLPLYYMFDVHNEDEVISNLKSVKSNMAHIKFIIHGDSVVLCDDLHKLISSKVEGKTYDVQYQYKTQKVDIERMSENLTLNEMFSKYVKENVKEDDNIKSNILTKGIKYLGEVPPDAYL